MFHLFLVQFGTFLFLFLFCLLFFYCCCCSLVCLFLSISQPHKVLKVSTTGLAMQEGFAILKIILQLSGKKIIFYS